MITHGTDTMEETAYFLEPRRQERQAGGAGRLDAAGDRDQRRRPGNLYNAVAAARSPEARGRGVLVVMNDAILNARDVTKTNTTNVETFASPERGPAGWSSTAARSRGSSRSDKKHTTKTEFSVAGRTTLPRVDIIYALREHGRPR